MKRVLTIVACLYMLPVSASHIVGGEFELLHISGNQYRLNLVWYYDVANNDPNRVPEVQEPFIDAAIFRKNDDGLMRTVRLFYAPDKVRVGYTQPACSSGEIVSDKLIYTAVIILPADEFGDEEGYYISWERCCRNYDISNIVSEDPNTQGGIAAGQTFYLEFPAVVRKGQPFVNSSPRLFPPLNDYACPGKPYYVDFSGIDDDGDSLAYSLVTPLNTHNASPLPGFLPRPYNDVLWQNNFDQYHVINGLPADPNFPDLSISHAGFLRVTPRFTGLFVFAVKIEEFRNEEKIGESRRDFQMLVTDCRVAEPPKIVGKKLSDAVFGNGSNMSVSFSNTVNDEQRCIIVRVTDPDAAREADNFTEFIRLKAVALNFNHKDLSELLPAESTSLIHNNDGKEFRICFPACPYFEGGAYQIGIIAFDDACALPLSDTLKVAVSVQPPTNAGVEFVTPDVTATLNEGDGMIWPFEARDADGDQLILNVKTNGFLMTTAGMTLTQESNEEGVLKGTLKWDAFCDIYDFVHRTGFQVELTVDDLDVCDLNEPAVSTFDLSVLLPGNANPIADTDLTPDPAEIEVNGIERRVLQNLNFNVTARDLIDNDHVMLRLAGRDFKPSDYGMSFQKAFGQGQVTAAFLWDLQCSKVDASNKNFFELMFIAVDSTNKCRVEKRDTVHVFVNVMDPVNLAPSLTIASLNPNIAYQGGEMHVVAGEPIRLSLTVRDEDIAPADEVRIDLVASSGEPPPEGFVFTPVIGTSPQTGTFEWSPDCSIFKDGDFSNDYMFRFIYMDNHCQTEVADTVEVAINISDLEVQEFEADPPNVFTPDGDDINDYFAMEIMQGNTPVNVLPPDNCEGQFRSVRIYNRWGRSVFESTDRNFRWYGENDAVGVYYYYIAYTNREYKGTVSLRY
jgi:hypothetical protein